MSNRGRVANPVTKRSTPRELFDDAQSEPIESIEFKYESKHFESLGPDPSWINPGDSNWEKNREEWVSHVAEGETDRGSYTHDVDAIATNIAKYRRFDEPVPLDLLAEILEITWIEAPTI